jgi:hypothetical protein
VDDRPGRERWDEDSRSADGMIARPASGLAARLHALIADARAEESADARARERWLRTAADADATLAGVLLDLGERDANVAIATVEGRRLLGTIELVGVDFISVRTDAGHEVLLAAGALASVRTAPSLDPAVGDRVATTDLRLADVLAELAADRTRVRLVVRDSGDVVAGELRSVGRDVLTLRTEGPSGGTTYVPLVAVVEASLG